jgi:hypothetical protein
MQYRPYDEISSIADVRVRPAVPMSRQERLGRWAEALEREPERQLSSLEEIEWQPLLRRRAIRADNSALTVAFEDPLLRADGLASDKLGDGCDFFQLLPSEAHFALCSCLHGLSTTGRGTALRVRRLMERRTTLADLRPFILIGSTSLAAVLAGALLLVLH